MLNHWLNTSCLLISILSSSFTLASTSHSNNDQIALRGRQQILTALSFDQNDAPLPINVEASNQSSVNNPTSSSGGDQYHLVLILGGLSAGLLGLVVGSYGFRLFTMAAKPPNVFFHAQYGKVMCLGTAASIFGFTMMGVGIHSYLDQNK